MLSPSFSRYFIVFIYFLSSCNTNTNSDKNDILRIDLAETENRAYLNASEVISSLEYVALETSPQCLVGEIVKAYVSENFILTFSNSNCLLFSRNGKFIRGIGQRGNGPQDFMENSYNVKIDEQSGMIYLLSSYEICAYRISGQFVKKLNLQDVLKKSDISSSLSNVVHWKENLFCANIALHSGKEPYRCIIFSLDGEIVKLFPNNIFFDTGKNGKVMMSTDNSEANIYLYNEQLYFRERLCDTLFRITNELDFLPEIIFDLPGYKMPTDMRGEFNARRSEYDLNKIFEVKNYILLNAGEIGSGYYRSLYDKNKNKSISFKSDPLLSRETVAPLLGGELLSRTSSLNGLRNDIDGGLPFDPHHISHIQNNNQMICIYHSYFLKEKLTDEHFTRYTIQDQDANKRLKKLLGELDWEDNPVIIIATFK